MSCEAIHDNHESIPLIDPDGAQVISPINESVLNTFQSHWMQCLDIIHNNSVVDVRQKAISPHDFDVLWKHWESMEELLTISFNEEGLEKSIWNCIIWNQILEVFLDWACSLLEFGSSTGDSIEAIHCLNLGVTSLWHLLSFCEKLISQTTLLKKVFPFQEIVCPLLRLPQSCQLLSPPQYRLLQQRLVFFLYQFCICLTTTSPPQQNDPFPLLNKVLQLVHTGSPSFIQSQKPQDSLRPKPHTFYSLPVPPCKNYLLAPLIGSLHCDDDMLSRWARDSLILLLNVTPHVPALAVFVAEESDFCPVLATGLGALFSELPRELPTSNWPEDWCQLQPKQWMNIPSLVNFLSSLDFCNYAVKVSHNMIGEQILEYLYSGFLQPILGPSLHQTSSDALVACTAYVELFLRRLHEPRLSRVFLRFLLCEEIDNTPILNTLIGRINANAHLCSVTLCLFRTLLSLHSEDVTYWLLFRHLQAPNHLFPSVYLQRPNSVNFLYERYMDCAQSFLSLATFTNSEKENTNGAALQSYYNDLQQMQLSLTQAVYNEWPGRYREYLPTVLFVSPQHSPYDLWLEKMHMLTLMDSHFTLSAEGTCSRSSLCENYEREENVTMETEEMELNLKPLTEQIARNMRESMASLYRINYFEDEEEDEPRSSSGDSDQKSKHAIIEPAAATDETESLDVHQSNEVEDNVDNESDLNDFLLFLDQEYARCDSQKYRTSQDVDDQVVLMWQSAVMSLDEEQQLMKSITCNQPLKFSTSASSFESQSDITTSLPAPLLRHLTYTEHSNEQLDWLLSVLNSPFILALLNKLHSFPRNTVFINILLTDLLTQVVLYPHAVLHMPLLLFWANQPLNSLNSKLISLYQALNDIQVRISTYAEKLQHWPRYLQNARHYLHSRAPQNRLPRQVLSGESINANKSSLSASSSQSSLQIIHDIGSGGEASASGPLLSINTHNDDVKHKQNELSKTVSNALSFGSRLKSIFHRNNLSSTSTNKTAQGSSIGTDKSPSHSRATGWVLLDNEYRFHIDPMDVNNILRLSKPQKVSLESGAGFVDMDRYSYESQRIRNYAYAAVLLEEFCLELCTVCRLHAHTLLCDDLPPA